MRKQAFQYFEAGNNLGSLLVFILIITPFWGFTQADISGKVVDNANGQTIPGATVFFNSATKGTITNQDGSFTLANVKKGQYDLVISCIGYATYYQKVIAGDDPVSLPVIKLTVKTTELREVKIAGFDPNRDKYLKMFMHEFLGNSAYARQCKILDPDIINVDFSSKTNILTANTNGYLVVENKALGYKVYYQVDKFSKNYSSKMLSYEGPVRFEELEGKPADQKKWAKNREAIYNGSSMHFLRSVFRSNFAQEGFKVLRLVRIPNANRPPDSLLRARIRKYSVSTQAHPEWRDSVSFYEDKMHLPKVGELLMPKPLTEKDFAQATDAKELMQLKFKDNLYVIYANKDKQPVDIDQLQTRFGMSGTVISLVSKRALFDSNGIFTDPSDTLFDGVWGLSGVSDLLPIDYMP